MSKEKNKSDINPKRVPSLKEILDSCLDEHKSVIKKYCTGHLNPRFLAKLPEKIEEIDGLSSIESSSSSSSQVFTFAKLNDELKNKKVKSENKDGNFERSKLTQKVLKEELKLPELMLPNINIKLCLPPSLQREYQKSDDYSRYNFVTSHLAGVSSKDQYLKLMEFDQTFLKGSTNISINTPIYYLKKKLFLGLYDNLQNNDKNEDRTLHRLHLYAGIWEDLIRDSFKFGSLLSIIKMEYDLHLGSLFEIFRKNHPAELIRSEELIRDLSKSLDADEGKDLRREVESLAEDCHHQLVLNLQLQNLLKKEQIIKVKKQAEKLKMEEFIKWSFSHWRITMKNKPNKIEQKMNKVKNTEQRLKILRYDLIKHLEKLSNEKKISRNHFVSKEVVKNLHAATKHLDVELQKLNQQVEVTTVLNIEKKRKIRSLIDVFMSTDVNYFSKVETFLNNIAMQRGLIPKSSTTTGWQLLQKARNRKLFTKTTFIKIDNDVSNID